MRKQLVAFLAAVLMTVCVAAAMLAVGAAALGNPSGTVAANSRAQISGAPAAASDLAQVQQLQALIVQYQAREQQFQAREQQYQQQLDRANAQVQQAQVQMQQIQQLLVALQQRGLISITSDGRIFINQ